MRGIKIVETDRMKLSTDMKVRRSYDYCPLCDTKIDRANPHFAPWKGFEGTGYGRCFKCGKSYLFTPYFLQKFQ
jgi:hypothetical protein